MAWLEKKEKKQEDTWHDLGRPFREKTLELSGKADSAGEVSQGPHISPHIPLRCPLRCPRWCHEWWVSKEGDVIMMMQAKLLEEASNLSHSLWINLGHSFHLLSPINRPLPSHFKAHHGSSKKRKRKKREREKERRKERKERKEGVLVEPGAV